MHEARGSVTADLDDPLLAAVAWARLTEPGDEAAGVLVAALGPVAALRWALGRDPDPPCEPLDPARWARARARWTPRAENLRPDREVAVIRRLGGDVLHRGDERWPTVLDELGLLAPHCLWVRGDPALLQAERSVALVGARASTGYGEHVAGEIAATLAAEGVVVVSGGAYGIDAVAHRSALAVRGPTVAVMAGGLDRFYPAGNTALLERVAIDGAVVAEVGPGSAPSRTRFLTRNRLIAALGQVCVVVEAGWRSGTTSTAGHATALLRPVGAVPGPVTSAASAGCHRLIREGSAVCVCDAGEVRELLGPLGEPAPEPESVPRVDDVPPGVRGRDAVVWDALPRRGAATLESLARVSGLSLRDVRISVGSLELGGHVRTEGERIRRAGR